MSEWRNPHVYLVWDTKNGKRYIGRSNGRPDYFASGKIITEVYNKRPETLKRKIVFESDNLQEVLNKEREYQQRRYDRGTWDLYYNLIIGDPSNGVDLSGELNPNFKTGKFVGRLSDPALYKKLDAEKHKGTWSEGRKQGCPRMLFFYYKKKGNKKEAEQSWNEWYSKAKFKSNNRQALQKTDTFKLWYNRNGNDLNFRKKYYEQSV
jgi:hypothetical protein